MLKSLVAIFVSLLFVPVCAAQWVAVSEMVSMKDLSYVEARELARQQALQKAIAEFKSVHRHQSLTNGVLRVEDELTEDQVKIVGEVIEREQISGSTLLIDYRVNLEVNSECSVSDAGQYKKSLALLGFSLQVPAQASVGGLHDIEHGFTSALGNAMSTLDSMLLFEQAYDSPFIDAKNAPTTMGTQRLLSHAMSYAKQLNAQFVVSGVIRDMGLVNPKAYSTSLWRKGIKFFAQANEQRRFSVDLFVHDGLTGELVWQDNFATEGAWTADIDEKIAFGSQAFWKMPYGKEIAKMLDGMAFSLGEEVRCQPFMTRIARIDGKTLHFGSGAAAGIRPGDRLNVYRSFNFHDALQRRGLQLTNAKTVLTVSQVHPNFASGVVNVDPGRINVQQDDVLIIW